MRKDTIQIGINDAGNYVLGEFRDPDTNQWMAYVWRNDDGTINEASYTESYRKKHGLGKFASQTNQTSTQSNSNTKQKKEKSSKSGDGCLMKIIKAPFKLLGWVLKLLWWVIVNVLKLIGIGFILEKLTEDD